MKRVLKLLCLPLLAAALLTGCGGEKPGSAANSRPLETLVWYLPTAGSYKASAEVSAAVNDRLQLTYPDIAIDFKFISIYEYAEKLSVYLAAGEQADIVWASDSVLPFLNYPSENVYKFLDAPIRTGAPNINERLSLDDRSLYKIYDRMYFIPAADHSGGLIPFLKIPRELLPLIDTDALLDVVNSGTQASAELFDIINTYLSKAASAGELRDGIELAAVSGIFPMIGYEPFISTDGLIGCSLSDDTGDAVDMLSAPSTRLCYDTYSKWMQRGYIKENTPITYRSGFDTEYSYILSGAWGCETENGYSMIMDKTGDGFAYIALDCRYHPTQLFTQSAAILPADGEHTESALKVLDLFYSDSEFYNLLTFGLEGTHYTRGENGTAVRISGEYRAFEGLVPRGGSALSSVGADSVYPAKMRAPQSFAGMKIPSSTKEFRRMLFDYTDACGVAPYSVSLPDNSGSDIGELTDIYNAS